MHAHYVHEVSIGTTSCIVNVTPIFTILASSQNMQTKTGIYDQVSFVNALWTIRAGKHVEHIVGQIVKNWTDLTMKKRENVS